MVSLPKIERDPNIKKLEQDIFAKMQDIVKPEQQQVLDSTSIKHVSFEEAIKELIEMNK